MSRRKGQGEIGRLAALQIAIDGPAGAGKSTVGRGIAEALGCPYMDTGLMYRSVTWNALRGHISLSDEGALTKIARNISFSLQDGATGRLLIDGEEAPPELHSPEVDEAVSEVSAHPKVREEMVQQQRQLASDRCVVMVGRDIGSTVLPNAPVKIWVTASARERAQRRMEERSDQAFDPGQEAILNEILERDRRDSSRAASPQRKPEDAIVIETDGLVPEETLQRALSAVENSVRGLQARSGGIETSNRRDSTAFEDE